MKIHICFYDRTFSTLVDVLACLAQMVDSDDVIQLEIRRFNVLEDLLHEMGQKNFHPRKCLNVLFIGESGRDTGGLT